MPKLARVLLAQIDEPKLPIRVAMDDRKMQELVESMREIGLLQPIGLRPVDGRFEIEFGHRRWYAARELGWKDISALIFTTKEIVAGAAMLAENVIREDITAAEEALLFAQAREMHGLDEEGLIKRFRRSADYIGERVRLLRQDPQVFDALLKRHISFAVAKELNKCTDESHRRYLLDAAMRGGNSARVVAEWVRQWRAMPTPQTSAEPVTSQPTPVPDPGDPLIACCFCGGHRDPYNLVSVYIHRWELTEIQKFMQQPPADDQTNGHGTPATTRGNGLPT